MSYWTSAFAISLSSIFFTCLGSSTGPKVVCYIGSWSYYRDGGAKFNPQEIDPFACTHIIYAFAKLGNNSILPMDNFLDLEENYGLANYQRLNNLKEKNTELKTLIAIGGWNEGSLKYSNMAASKKSRKQFVYSVLQFLRKHEFDGLEVDWEYPAKRGGHQRDRKKFILLLRDLKKAFLPYNYTLSAAISAGKETIDTSYDVPKLNKYLDFVNLMSYDFFGPWDSTVGHNAPLFHRPNQNEESSIDFSVTYLLQKGLDKSKLLLGLPFYGRSFTLSDKNRNQPFSPSLGAGKAGVGTGEAGYLSYFEICLIQKNGRSVTKRDDYWLAPYLLHEDQWIGFDDVSSIRMKVEYSRSAELGGVMIWSLDNDDFRGYCGQGKSPLLYTVIDSLYSPLNGTIIPSPTLSDESESENTLDYVEDKNSIDSTIISTAFKCPAQGMFRDPNDCSRFFHCFGSGTDLAAVEKACLPGTVFSEDWQICVWPHQANC